jgi:hypothetical protein
MTTFAGTMFSGTQVNPQWVAADGKPYYVLDHTQSYRTHTGISRGDRRDYVRAVGWQGRRLGLGPIGWIIAMPVNSGWVVSTADDSVEGTLASPPTVNKPPAGTR